MNEYYSELYAQDRPNEKKIMQLVVEELNMAPACFEFYENFPNDHTVYIHWGLSNSDLMTEAVHYCISAGFSKETKVGELGEIFKSEKFAAPFQEIIRKKTLRDSFQLNNEEMEVVLELYRNGLPDKPGISTNLVDDNCRYILTIYRESEIRFVSQKIMPKVWKPWGDVIKILFDVAYISNVAGYQQISSRYIPSYPAEVRRELFKPFRFRKTNK